jgi:hypothetical protein
MTPGAAFDAMTTEVVEYRPADQQAQVGLGQQLDYIIVVQSRWEVQPIQAALSLRTLPQGWDHAGSPPPADKAVERAIYVIISAAKLGFDDIAAPHVFPVPGGGVQLEWLQGDRRLEVEVLPDGSTQFVSIRGGDPVKEGEYPLWPPTEAKTLFSWLASGA